MTSKGAFVIIQNSNQEILLVKRRDIPFWDFPGGKVEKNELEKDCAVREAFEETGLTVDTNELIGIYHKPKKHDTQYIYSATIDGGKIIENGPETKEIRYFPPNNLPLNLIPLRKKQIQDFLANKKDCTVVVKENPCLLLFEKILKNKKQNLN